MRLSLGDTVAVFNAFLGAHAAIRLVHGLSIGRRPEISARAHTICTDSLDAFDILDSSAVRFDAAVTPALGIRVAPVDTLAAVDTGVGPGAFTAVDVAVVTQARPLVPALAVTLRLVTDPLTCHCFRSVAAISRLGAGAVARGRRRSLETSAAGTTVVGEHTICILSELDGTDGAARSLCEVGGGRWAIPVETDTDDLVGGLERGNHPTAGCSMA